MPSLAKILTEYPGVLVLDAASLRIQVGWLRPDRPALWQMCPEEAGTGLFRGVREVLRLGEADLDHVAAFIFCEGPGSILGIRTAAMAIRTWQVLRMRPAFAYQSLALTAVHEWSRDPRALAVIADARRDTWHCHPIDRDGQLSALERRAPAALPAEPLLTPDGFRSWSPAPAQLTVCRYELAEIFPAIGDRDLFHLTPAPDAYQHSQPDYKRWSAQVHQAPVPTDR